MSALKGKGTLITLQEYEKKNHKNLYNMTFYIEENSMERWLGEAIKINELDNVDFVYTLEDDLQEVALRICETLGVNYTYSKGSIELSSNKYKMRKHLSKEGFDSLNFSDNLNAEKIIKFVSNYGTSILKPKKGSASKDIYKISKCSLKEIADLINNLKIEEFIIEQFIEGKEFSVESYSEGGIHKIYCITEKIKGENFIELGHIVPASLSHDEISMIQSDVMKFLDIMNVINGPCHTEIIVTNEGLKIVESQARFGGDQINDLYDLAFDKNIIETIFRGMVTKDQIDDIDSFHINVPRYAAISYLPPKAGLVEKIEINEKYIKEFNIKEYRVWCKEKDILSMNVSSSGRIAQAISVGKSRNESISNANHFLKRGINIKFS
ncbi:ATP-grasp domain-containing protein [Staphylococcus lutrae]|uniref:ATP-grasp domain-containing protein n=1 Tax=Staphylococcus lutrae TaxID=155085 RepID=A0AAC9WIV2_9STAP|nr:ATP-grasp domain-containing protein [Staphylococcus lutrae]ARJ50654.1 hypothetical protein B5P37_04640 [Staphylococcus lutrae]PNZ39126.1 ATP-grasp domain-containing protein [Staphylococcus lutrae]